VRFGYEVFGCVCGGVGGVLGVLLWVFWVIVRLRGVFTPARNGRRQRYSVDPEYPDYEVIAYIEGYGNLVRKKHFWEYDWADCGLQKGSPRNPFPWSYVRLGREACEPFYDRLLTDIPNTPDNSR
jgi:hypothetical protein